MAGLFSLQVTLKCVEEETVVWDAVPVKNFLLFLRADAIVLVEKVEEGALGLLERCIIASFQVSKIRKDAFFEFLRVLDGTTESLKTKGKTPDNVSTGDVKEIVPGVVSTLLPGERRAIHGHTPEDTRYVFTSGKEKAANELIVLPVDRRGYQKILDCRTEALARG